MCATRWRTSACRRFPCSSCRARRSWRTSAVWRRDRGARTARRCLVWTRSPATIVTPDHNRVVPLEPEFIVTQDGQEKQDCESRAVRRWLERHGRRHAQLKPIYLGDDLLSPGATGGLLAPRPHADPGFSAVPP